MRWTWARPTAYLACSAAREAKTLTDVADAYRLCHAVLGIDR